ncbi:MAG: hypothetical protein AAF585_06720 [Verrucomicrobiota bacterium]
MKTLCWLFAIATAAGSAAAEDRWYRGNTHTHSLWSDGNDFPEMIVDWYKERGYDFIALSDHNILAVGENWMTLDAVAKRQRTIGRRAIDKYRARFGGDWVQTRESDAGEEVRLRRIDEYRPKFEEEEKFLIIQAEEISSSSQGKPVHINAVNLPGKEIIPAVKSDAPVVEVMRENLRAVQAREEETGQPILAHLNHPNFQWAITAEDLANVVEEQFFEVYNGHPGIRHLGDEEHPGDEKIWDIANTIRLSKLDAEPLFGVATDDSHTYHGGPVSPGRGWIMVRAESLNGDAIVRAMRAGEFYASSGVTVNSFAYTATKRLLEIEIEPVEGVTFTTQLIGTRKEHNESSIGEIIEEKTGVSLSFEVPDDVLYVRGTITSGRSHPNPSFEGQMEQAWLQPVAWR